jgi:hypothetical protein
VALRVETLSGPAQVLRLSSAYPTYRETPGAALYFGGVGAQGQAVAVVVGVLPRLTPLHQRGVRGSLVSAAGVVRVAAGGPLASVPPLSLYDEVWEARGDGLTLAPELSDARIRDGMALGSRGDFLVQAEEFLRASAAQSGRTRVVALGSQVKWASCVVVPHGGLPAVRMGGSLLVWPVTVATEAGDAMDVGGAGVEVLFWVPMGSGQGAYETWLRGLMHGGEPVRVVGAALGAREYNGNRTLQLHIMAGGFVAPLRVGAAERVRAALGVAAAGGPSDDAAWGVTPP